MFEGRQNSLMAYQNVLVSDDNPIRIYAVQTAQWLSFASCLRFENVAHPLWIVAMSRSIGMYISFCCDD